MSAVSFYSNNNTITTDPVYHCFHIKSVNVQLNRRLIVGVVTLFTVGKQQYFCSFDTRNHQWKRYVLSSSRQCVSSCAAGSALDCLPPLFQSQQPAFVLHVCTRGVTLILLLCISFLYILSSERTIRNDGNKLACGERTHRGTGRTEISSNPLAPKGAKPFQKSANQPIILYVVL